MSPGKFCLNARVASALTAIILLVFYQSTYTFSYFPITEGWFSLYAKLILEGNIPHRDFSLLLSPFYPLHIALVQAMFGESIWVLRILGICVTCGIGLALWALLVRFFNPWVSAFASIVGTIYYQSGNAYIGYDFTQFLTLYLLIGCWFLVKDLLDPKESRFSSLLARAPFFAGMCLAAAVLTKHSNGVLAAFTLSVSYFFIVVRTRSFATALRCMGSLILGGVCVVFPIAIWLAANNALHDLAQQVFFSALAAKGGADKIFTGWIFGLLSGDTYPASLKVLTKYSIAILLLCALPPLVFSVLLSAFGKAKVVGWMRLWQTQWVQFVVSFISLVGIVLLAVVIVSTYTHGPLLSPILNDKAAIVYNMAILMSTHLYAIGLLVSFIMIVLAPSKKIGSMNLLFALGVGLTLGNGTSAGLSEISAFFGVAFALAFLMHISGPAILPMAVPVVLASLLTAFLVERKFSMPYHWWGTASDDVRTVDCEISEGILAGLCIEKNKSLKINSLVSEIKRNSREGDELYVFPHMPIFNLLSVRNPYRNAVVSWFDFTSEKQARDLNQSLSSSPPQVVVVARLPEEVFSTHEHLFNRDKESVQREIVDTINQQIKTGFLNVAYATVIDGVRIELLVRTH